MSVKQYAPTETYEKKLGFVMNRFGVDKYTFNYDRFGAWIEFRYKSELYRFDHSVDNAKAHGQKLNLGSDCFAQLVLSLEDLARMTERGIYDLSRWIVGMRFLPPPVEIPECFRFLGFTETPSADEVKERFRKLSQIHHPDKGGKAADFDKLKKASEEALQIVGGGL